jgi:hypothetical protein
LRLISLYSEYLIKHDVFPYNIHNCKVFVPENFLTTPLFYVNIITINITTYYRIPGKITRNDSEDDDIEETAGIIYSLAAVVTIGAMTDQFWVHFLLFSCPLQVTDSVT